MTLLERSKALTVDIEAVGTAKALAQQVQAIATRAEAFETAGALLQAAAARTASLRSKGVEVQAKVASVKNVRDALAQWRGRVGKDPSAAVGDGLQGVQTQVLAPVKKIAATLETGAREGWKRHALARLPKVDKDMLVLLESIPGQVERIRSFRELYDRTLGFAQETPSSEQEYSRFDRYATQCDKEWRELDASDLPEAVKRFLREAASSAGAPLATLVPSVVEWLEKHGWSAKFRIRSR